MQWLHDMKPYLTTMQCDFQLKVVKSSAQDHFIGDVDGIMKKEMKTHDSRWCGTSHLAWLQL